MKTIKAVYQFVQQYREVLFPVLGMALVWLAILFVGELTGRGVLDDPGVIVAYLYNALGVLIVFAIVGAVQSHLFGYRARNRDRGQKAEVIGQQSGVSLRDDVYDAVVTLILAAAVGYAVLFR